MNKIPKCNTRNSFTRNYLKLTKKLSVENRIMNRKIQKKLKNMLTRILKRVILYKLTREARA